MQKQSKSLSNKITHKFTDFVALLLLLLRAMRSFQWKTGTMRGLKFVSEKEIALINDITYMVLPSTVKGKFNFIKNKFIRIKILAFKKKFKQFNNLLSKKIIKNTV